MFLSCLVFAISLCASVYMCFVVTCWERADLLALVCGVSFPIGVLGQVLYLIVSIPVLRTLTYSDRRQNTSKAGARWREGCNRLTGNITESAPFKCRFSLFLKGPFLRIVFICAKSVFKRLSVILSCLFLSVLWSPPEKGWLFSGPRRYV